MILEDATGAEEVVEIADGHWSDIEIVEIVILKIIVNENLSEVTCNGDWIRHGTVSPCPGLQKNRWHPAVNRHLKHVYYSEYN